MINGPFNILEGMSCLTPSTYIDLISDQIVQPMPALWAAWEARAYQTNRPILGERWYAWLERRLERIFFPDIYRQRRRPTPSSGNAATAETLKYPTALPIARRARIRGAVNVRFSKSPFGRFEALATVPFVARSMGDVITSRHRRPPLGKRHEWKAEVGAFRSKKRGGCSMRPPMTPCRSILLQPEPLVRSSAGSSSSAGRCRLAMLCDTLALDIIRRSRWPDCVLSFATFSSSPTV